MNLRVLIFFHLMIIMHANVVSGVMAEDLCIFPTTTKEVSFPPEWYGGPEIHAEKLTIARGEGIALWCTVQDGIPCSSFSWTVSGKGFHFEDVSGPTTGQTEEEFQIIELWADTTACGTATITVTDACGKSVGGTIRSTNSGKWVLIESVNCGYWTQARPSQPSCECGGTVTIGGQRWRSQWVGGTLTYHYSLCEPYPQNVFPDGCVISNGGYFKPPAGTPCCYTVGFEPCFAVSINRPGWKYYWEWRCP
jgi:hypothetical protein